MSQSKKAAKSALVIIFFTIASKGLGFLREVLIAEKFGSGMETDTFFIALTATGLFTRFIREAVSTTFIPVISEVENKEGRLGKIEHTNNMLHTIFFAGAVIVAIAMLGAPVIVKVIAGGFKGEQFSLAVRLVRIGLPTILFSGIIGVFTGYLQSEEKFNSTALIGIPLNAAYIVFLLLFSSRFGVKGMMVSVVIGTFLQILIQLPETKSTGFKYKFIFDIKDKYIKRVLYLSMPVLIGVAIADLNAIVDKTIASTLSTGSISALNYANKLNALILSVFIMAITTVIFPILSKEANNGNMKGVKKTMGQGINLILLITIPAAIGMIILARPVVQIAFERGAFGPRATDMTSQSLVFYSLGLTFMSLKIFITRVYYSIQDTKTPMINSFIAVGLNIVFNLILVRQFAHAGLAFATSLSHMISTVILFVLLRKKIGNLGTKSYFRCAIKSIIGSAIMGVVAYLTYNGLYSMLGTSTLYNLISLIAAIGLGVIVYGVVCYVIGVKEVRELVDNVIDRIRNRK